MKPADSPLSSTAVNDASAGLPPDGHTIASPSGSDAINAPAIAGARPVRIVQAGSEGSAAATLQAVEPGRPQHAAASDTRADQTQSKQAQPGATPAVSANAGEAPSSPEEAVLAFVSERLGSLQGSNGEVLADHSRGVVRILTELHADPSARIAGALVSTGGRFGLDEIEQRFGREVCDLVDLTRQVERLREIHRRVDNNADGTQLEVLRRMMLAMSSDIRVVLIRLASRLQTLRFFAAAKRTPDPALSAESLEVLAPLANRLGLWQIKWEIEDLSFRFLEPQTYRHIARQLDDKRREREQLIAEAIQRLRERLTKAGIEAEVSGRPKHIYSIHSKMRSKGLPLDGIRDLHGLRVIVSDVQRCYEVLSLIHEMWTPVPGEYDDYISRPKPNGYQSLHTVVTTESGRSLEVQIRTRDMHHHAEYGVASHWAYKETSTGLAGSKGLQSGESERLAWLRQLLAWQREVGVALGGGARRIKSGGELIYVLTPQGKVVELPEGSTPIDFAYHVHTDLGHRCRGARVDGQLVSLNTTLHNGQTVEILSVRRGSGNEGPSRDWLNPELGYVRSSRAKTKLRQWFNARELERDMATGRERLEKIMQREGKTALAMPELAARLGQPNPDAMFAAVGREEIGLRAIEEAVRGAPVAAPAANDEIVVTRAPSSPGAVARDGGVLVVGVDLLMTQLARCCRPVPPDPIVGFVTRGRGVSVHRLGCKSFERMRQETPERVIETAWGLPRDADRVRRFPVEVQVQASDREGLLRDISEVFARDRLNVVAVNTLTRGHTARMQFTVEVPDSPTLQRALAGVAAVRGVFEASRKAL